MNNDAILSIDSPSDWETKKIKYIFDERTENNDPVKTDVLVSLTHDRGVILHSDKGNIGNKEKDDLTKYKLVYPGDILTNSMNVIIGSSGLSEYYGLVSPVYYILVAKSEAYDKKFFHYLFRSVVFQKSLVGLGNGILEHRMRIPMDKLGDQFIPFPKPEEQNLISLYLDKKTGQIDVLIEKMQQKIELLKEKRMSLINKFVTKGLDSNIQMQDSGIAWIGEIPKHWEMKKLKHIVSYNTDTLSDGTNPKYQFHYIEIGDVNYIEGILINEKIAFAGSPSRARRIAQPKDVIVSTVRTYLRAIGVVPDIKNVICSTGFCVLRGDSEVVEQEFLSYSVNSEWFISEVISNSSGVSYPAIQASALVEIKIVVPPLNEQKIIFQCLDKNTGQIDALIEKMQKKISFLSEYRQSLISSVVTGKVRVTEKMI